MRALTTLLAVALCAAAWTASAGAKNPAPVVQQQGQGGYLLDPWPKIPNKYSQAVAKAAFSHQYGTVWGYLDPSLQKAVSETSWQSCQVRYPLTSPGVKIKSVRVVDSKKVPTVLPLLGSTTMRAITLQVLFTSPASSGEQIALEYAYFVQHKGTWSAVWLAETYALYKAGKCDTSQNRSLY